MSNPKDKKNKLAASIQSLNKKKEESTSVVKPIIQETKVKKRVGRPSNKKEGVKYVKVGGLLPEETKIAMQKALLEQFRGIHDTQDEFLDAAVLFYIENYK